MRPAVAITDARHIVEEGAEWGALLAEAAGISIILIGAVVATVVFLRRVAARDDFHSCFEAYRRSLGRAILLGLEFLVAADIIGTVLVNPTFRNLGVLAILVAIRTFLSFSLTVEIEGRWPWQRKEPGRTRDGLGGRAGEPVPGSAPPR